MKLYFTSTATGIWLTEFRTFYSRNLPSIINEDLRNYGTVQTNASGLEIDNTFSYLNNHDGRHYVPNRGIDYQTRSERSRPTQLTDILSSLFNQTQEDPSENIIYNDSSENDMSFDDFLTQQVSNLFAREILSLSNNLGVNPAMVMYIIARGAFPRHPEIQTVSEERLDEIPIQKFGDINDNHKEKYPTCVVCSEDFTNDDEVRQLECEHMYHIPCIDRWLKTYSSQCPICKKKVE